MRAFWPFGFPETAWDGHELEEAEGAGREAVDMARRLGRADLVSAALDSLSSALTVRGLYNRVAEVTDDRLALVDQVHDPWEVGDILAVAGWNRFHLGRYKEGAGFASRGVALAGAAPSFTLHCMAWLVVNLTRMGAWDEALRHVTQAEQLLGERASDPPGFVRRLFGGAALIHEARGDTARADQYLAITFRDRIRGRGAGAAVWAIPILARRGRFDEAFALAAEDWTSALRANRGLALEGECELVAESGAWERAEDVLARSRQHAEEAGLLSVPAFADRLEGRAAHAAGQTARSVDILRRARDGFASLEARWEAAVTDLSLAEALLQAGRRGEAAELLPGALAVFEELRCIRELAQARELLTKLR
jgi:hypothetical protein